MRGKLLLIFLFITAIIYSSEYEETKEIIKTYTYTLENAKKIIKLYNIDEKILTIRNGDNSLIEDVFLNFAYGYSMADEDMQVFKNSLPATEYTKFERMKKDLDSIILEISDIIEANNQERYRLYMNKIADKHGLTNYYNGILHAQINASFDKLKECLLAPMEEDIYRVDSIIDNFVIYSINYDYETYQFALKKEKGVSYPSKSKLNLDSYYVITGTKTFTNQLGQNIELMLLKEIKE